MRSTERSAALGVDNSAVAVELTRRRGGTAIQRDLFAPLPAEGSWERVLLADGNIGIGGDPVRTLRRVADLLAPGGIVVAEIDPPSAAVGQEMLRWETCFPWSRVNAAALGDIAGSAGFLLSNVVDIHARVIAVLATAVRGGARGSVALMCGDGDGAWSWFRGVLHRRTFSTQPPMPNSPASPHATSRPDGSMCRFLRPAHWLYRTVHAAVSNVGPR
jgi:hypothetical protein